MKYCKSTHGLHRQLVDYCKEIEMKKTKSILFESSTEKLFYNHLINNGIKFDYQVSMDRYRIDFLLKTRDNYLCVELDGSSHAGKQSYDYSRDKFLESCGYDVLRIANEYFENNIDEIITNLKCRTCKI